jgi:hypothetical protein
MDQVHRKDGCYDKYLDFKEHDPLAAGQRYLNQAGNCKPLRVQTRTLPPGIELNIPAKVPDYVETEVTHNHPWDIGIAAKLVGAFPPKSRDALITWIIYWPLLWLATTWELLVVITGPYFQTNSSGSYPGYVGRFWAQFWKAKSRLEHSVLREKNDIPTRAHHPRQLMVDPEFVLSDLSPSNELRERAERARETGDWVSVNESDGQIQYLKTARYIAISYRRGAYRLVPGPHLDRDLAHGLRRCIRAACVQLKAKAYWLDEQCMDQSSDAEKSKDIYRIADVFRGAAATVITIPDLTDVPQVMTPHSIPAPAEEFKLWGGRIWTFPECLLSQALYYKIGDHPAYPTQLRQLTNIAFDDYKEAVDIIDHYSGKDSLSRIQFLSGLKEALWRRGRETPQEGDANNVPNSPVPKSSNQNATLQVDGTVPAAEPTNGSAGGAPPAERVYALMGLFEHRIEPNYDETEDQALARLSMANDSDYFTERMLSMFPSHIQETSCWYSDDDRYDCRLWDVDPHVQVAGITESGALVFDGCQATSIRWKNFPSVVRATKRGFKKSLAKGVVLASPFLLILGGIFVKLIPGLG